MVYLFLVHVTGANGTDQNFVAMATQGKGNKQASALVGFANADKPILFPGMGRIRKNRHGLAKCGFYFCYFNAVLLALFQVATIPIESCYILYSNVL
jgi:hypothetical protein